MTSEHQSLLTGCTSTNTIAPILVIFDDNHSELAIKDAASRNDLEPIYVLNAEGEHFKCLVGTQQLREDNSLGVLLLFYSDDASSVSDGRHECNPAIYELSHTLSWL